MLTIPRKYRWRQTNPRRQARPTPRGAEWRKSDLHVHSPASVIGINDYRSVAGYREVLRHLRAAPGEIAGNQGYREADAGVRRPAEGMFAAASEQAVTQSARAELAAGV
jgi:hypothetical protein